MLDLESQTYPGLLKDLSFGAQVLGFFANAFLPLETKLGSLPAPAGG